MFVRVPSRCEARRAEDAGQGRAMLRQRGRRFESICGLTRCRPAFIDDFGIVYNGACLQPPRLRWLASWCPRRELLMLAMINLLAPEAGKVSI